MNFKALFLIVFCGLVSACGHLQNTPSEAQTNRTSTAGNPSPAQSGTESQTNGQLGEHQTGASPHQTYQGQVVAEKLPAARQADLLDRIRSGFRFPALESKHTRHYEKWNAQHKAYLKGLFARAEPFLYHIVEEIEKRNLPTELALLPAIESAYKPRAVSRSGAGGLWQFVPSTGRHYGLRQDQWYDARRDALAATTAALDYLVELNAMFDGDWLLTLAAYNAGQGTILRAIKANKRKHRKTDYQSLSLRSETERYVPKLIALRNIILNPHLFNVELPSIPNQQHFQVVSLPGQVNLHTFSEKIDVEPDALLHLNAAHRQAHTTPDGPHRMLVPITASAKVDSAVQYFKDNPIAQYQHYKIRRGDSLSGIARRYGVSVNTLKNANKLNSNSIRAGHSLKVPTAGMSGDELALNSNSSANKVTHRVVRGDTLWSISKQYRVRVAQLLSWNKIASNQILSLGQSLLVFHN